MLDWLTLKREVQPNEYEAIAEYLSEKPQIMKWTPSTGAIEWAQPVRESIRSDSHQVQIYVTYNTITISGSPCNSLGLSDNVFGTSNIREAISAHLAVATAILPFEVGQSSQYRITRVDVTHNFDMGGSSEVRQALAYLRSFDGGRYRVNTSAETVYWSQGSSLRSGKAYHKGSHIRYTNKRGTTDIDSERVNLSDRLLRLELKLGHAWFSRKRKENINSLDINYDEEFNNYFSQIIGNVEVKEMNLREKVINVSLSSGQGLSAYRTWALIKAVGHHEARDSMPASTWYRHTKLLKDAGLGWGDFATGQVVPLRKRTLILENSVTSWNHLRSLSA